MPDIAVLNPHAVNCIRLFPQFGDVVWGARTLAGGDQAASDWTYVPVRRLALYIETSVHDGSQVGGLRTERRTALVRA